MIIAIVGPIDIKKLNAKLLIVIIKDEKHPTFALNIITDYIILIFIMKTKKRMK
jgi:hypothetical protein